MVIAQRRTMPACATEAGAGAYLCLVPQPVVEGVTVTLGGSRALGVAVTAVTLAVGDLV